MPDEKRKAEALASMHMFSEAAEVAAQSKDSALLSRIQGMVGNAAPLHSAISQLKDRINFGRQ